MLAGRCCISDFSAGHSFSEDWNDFQRDMGRFRAQTKSCIDHNENKKKTQHTLHTDSRKKQRLRYGQRWPAGHCQCKLQSDAEGTRSVLRALSLSRSRARLLFTCTANGKRVWRPSGSCCHVQMHAPSLRWSSIIHHSLAVSGASWSGWGDCKAGLPACLMYRFACLSRFAKKVPEQKSIEELWKFETMAWSSYFAVAICIW